MLVGTIIFLFGIKLKINNIENKICILKEYLYKYVLQNEIMLKKQTMLYNKCISLTNTNTEMYQKLHKINEILNNNMCSDKISECKDFLQETFSEPDIYLEPEIVQTEITGTQTDIIEYSEITTQTDEEIVETRTENVETEITGTQTEITGTQTDTELNYINDTYFSLNQEDYTEPIEDKNTPTNNWAFVSNYFINRF
jgi:hypothetical protein